MREYDIDAEYNTEMGRAWCRGMAQKHRYSIYAGQSMDTKCGIDAGYGMDTGYGIQAEVWHGNRAEYGTEIGRTQLQMYGIDVGYVLDVGV